MHLVPGQIYADKYRLLRLLGEGSMGAVYEAENVRIHRRVALKTLHASLMGRAEAVARFEREAQAAGRIGSPHIVEVLDVGELQDHSRYLVMELLDGNTLGERIQARGRLPPLEAAPIVHELLAGLGAAHQAGIIHRDLKPANVFLLRKHDFVKILDFGVSKFDALGPDASMTRTGAVLGTPYYMSPEQAKGSRDVDARSDLYAVGVILYECVTGQVPFFAETYNELLFKIVLEAPLPAESFVPDLDPMFASILRRAMAREVGERFQSAAEFQQVLGDWIARAAAAGSMPEIPQAMQPWSAVPAVGATAMLDPAPPLPPARPLQQPTVQQGWAESSQAPADPVRVPMSSGPLLPAVLFGAALVAGGVAALLLSLRGDPATAARAAAPSASVQPAPDVDAAVASPIPTEPAADADTDAGAAPPTSAQPAVGARSVTPPSASPPRPRSSAAATPPTSTQRDGSNPSTTTEVPPTANTPGRRISDEL